MKKITTLLLPLVVLSICLVGCGKKTKGPKTVPVSGTLKIGGAPASGIQITLTPVGEGLQSAGANSDDSGRYTFYTGQTGTPGVMPGKYKVTLRSLSGEGDDGYMNQTEDNATETGDGGVEMPTVTDSKVPEKYLSVETTDKEIEITGKDNDLLIEVE